MEESLRTPSYQVRSARPADVEGLFRLKQELARAEGNEGVLGATVRDWLRDGFGDRAQFTALVAEGGGRIVGMLTYSPIYLTALAGCVFSVQDLFVEPTSASRLSAIAMAQGIPLIQLNVHEDNAARQFYDRAGFQHLRECLTYAIGGGAMRDLAAMADLGVMPPA